MKHTPDFYRNDPGKSFQTAALYLGAVANRCGLAAWKLDMGFPATDADDQSFLIVARDKLTDTQFNCLASHVIAPNVQISQVSR